MTDTRAANWLEHNFICIRSGLRSHGAWLLLFFVTIPIAIFAGARYVSPLVNGPAIVIVRAKVLDTTVPLGGSLKFRIVANDRTSRNCIGTVTREFHKWTTLDGERVREKRRMAMVAGPIAIPGETVYTIVVPLPVDIEPGDWEYRGRTTYDCGFWFGGIRNYDTPALSFSVVPAPNRP